MTNLGFRYEFHAKKAEEFREELEVIFGPVEIEWLSILEEAVKLGGVPVWEGTS